MANEGSRGDYTVCDQCRLKKIRCGREKPSCANCERAGQACRWSGHGKKGSRIAALNRDVSGIANRLQQLEASKKSMFATQAMLRRLSVDPTSLSSPPFSEVVDNSTNRVAEEVTGPTFPRPPARFIANDGASPRCCGPVSLESLTLAVKETAAKVFESSIPSGFDDTLTQRRIDSILEHASLEQDGSSPAMPPFSILDGMIATYFEYINPRFPIWTKAQFLTMTHKLRESECSQDEDVAASLCCNNLILMTLTAKMLCSRKSSGTGSSTRTLNKTSSIDSDLMTSLLTNAKRALSTVGQLVSPRLVSVQSLLSLTLVAIEHLSIDLAETAFALAARCADSIGVHHWHMLKDQLNHEEVQERQNVSHCLFILDKMFCWSSNSSTRIRSSDINHPSHLISSDDPATARLAAKVELAKIEEIVFLELYSNQKSPRTAEEVTQVVFALSRTVQDYLNILGLDLEEVEDSLETSEPKLEAALGVLHLQLLLIWPFKDHPHALFRRGPDIARKYLKLSLRLWAAKCAQGTEPMFSTFSCVTVHAALHLCEVFSDALQGRTSDIDILRRFTDDLPGITLQYGGAQALKRRLYQMSSLLVELATAAQAQNGQQRRPSRLEFTPSPGDTADSSGHPKRVVGGGLQLSRLTNSASSGSELTYPTTRTSSQHSDASMRTGGTDFESGLDLPRTNSSSWADLSGLFATQNNLNTSEAYIDPRLSSWTATTTGPFWDNMDAVSSDWLTAEFGGDMT